jgi:hypothetical protein
MTCSLSYVEVRIKVGPNVVTGGWESGEKERRGRVDKEYQNTFR